MLLVAAQADLSTAVLRGGRAVSLPLAASGVHVDGETGHHVGELGLRLLEAIFFVVVDSLDLEHREVGSALRREVRGGPCLNLMKGRGSLGRGESGRANASAARLVQIRSCLHIRLQGIKK